MVTYVGRSATSTTLLRRRSAWTLSLGGAVQEVDLGVTVPRQRMQGRCDAPDGESSSFPRSSAGTLSEGTVGDRHLPEIESEFRMTVTTPAREHRSVGTGTYGPGGHHSEVKPSLPLSSAVFTLSAVNLRTRFHQCHPSFNPDCGGFASRRRNLYVPLEDLLFVYSHSR